MKKRIILILLAFAIAASAFGVYAVKIGDHNGDGNIDANDAVHLLYHYYFPQSYDLADANAVPEASGEFDASEFINENTITSYCNTNEKAISGSVKAIIVELPGLGGSSCLGGSVNMGDYLTAFTYHCAENGIVVAYMFPGPWAWGNKAEVRMADAVVDALAKKYKLGDDYPLIVCGGSMGGLGSLIYAADTAHKKQLVGVMAACPCVDVLDRFNASASYPRSFVSAVASYDMPLKDALKTISPIERIGDMPDVPYFICSDGSDEVFPEAQCDAYIEKLTKAGLDVTYRKQPGLKHGFFTTEVEKEYRQFLLKLGLNGDEEVNPPAGPSENDLKIVNVKKVSSTQLEITFSEPVVKQGGVFSGIRLTADSGVGVARAKVGSTENVVLQFSGSLALKSGSVWTWTMSTPEDPLKSITTIDQIINKEGVLYGMNNPVKFCIEEVTWDAESKPMNKFVGKIDNFSAVSDSSNHLVASQESGPKSWEGVYVDITTE